MDNIPVDIKTVIDSIIEVDKSARRETNEAEEAKKNADLTIARKIGEMREEYMARAEERVAKFKEFEGKAAAEEYVRSHGRFTRQTAQIEQARSNLFDTWVGEITDKILQG